MVSNHVVKVFMRRTFVNLGATHWPAGEYHFLSILAIFLASKNEIFEPN